jgi:fructose-bisphosphate aldolase class 1
MSQEQSKQMDDGGGLAANDTSITTIRKRVFYVTFALKTGN